MKTKNNLKRNVFRWTYVVALSFAVLISCQKKDSSNANYVQPIPYGQSGVVGNCAGCTFQQVQLGQPISRAANNNIAIEWSLLGDNVAIQALAYNGSSVKNYSGPVAVSGRMTVNTTIPLSGGYNGYGCQIPAGQYQINTLQVGNMTMGSFTVPQFEAISGAARIIFSLNNAVVADPNATGTIAQIYGQLVPLAMANGAQQMPCNDVGFYLSY